MKWCTFEIDCSQILSLPAFDSYNWILQTNRGNTYQADHLFHWKCSIISCHRNINCPAKLVRHVQYTILSFRPHQINLLICEIFVPEPFLSSNFAKIKFQISLSLFLFFFPCVNHLTIYSFLNFSKFKIIKISFLFKNLNSNTFLKKCKYKKESLSPICQSVFKYYFPLPHPFPRFDVH